MRIGYLWLRSNLGHRRGQMQAAVDELPSHGVRVLESSSIYDSDNVARWPIVENAYLNACVQVETELEPEEMLEAFKVIEREHFYDRDDPRPLPGARLEINVLLLGDVEYASDRLRVPHEEALGKRFILISLLEIDRDITMPSGTRLADVLDVMPLEAGFRDAGGPLLVDSWD